MVNNSQWALNLLKIYRYRDIIIKEGAVASARYWRRKGPRTLSPCCPAGRERRPTGPPAAGAPTEAAPPTTAPQSLFHIHTYIHTLNECKNKLYT